MENKRGLQEQSKPKQKQKKGNGVFIGVILGIFGLIMVAVFIFTTKQNKQEISRLETENQDLKWLAGEHDSLVNEWVISMVEIERELQMLQGKEEELIQQSYGPEISPKLRENIMAEIEGIQKELEGQRAKIEQLNARLKKSGIQIAALNTQVDQLKTSISTRDSSLMTLKNELNDKEILVAELNTTVENLNGNLKEFETEIEDYQVMVEQQKAELNKAYVATADIKELEEKGVIEKEGGFLGLGKSKTVKEDLNEESFSSVDITEIRKIDLNAKKATLISEHPSDSYTLVENDSTIAYLEINDPDKFWKITRYAVVATKN